MWNASNGHLLNKMDPADEAEVTGIIPLSEKSKIVTVGWNRKIVVYYDDIEVEACLLLRFQYSLTYLDHIFFLTDHTICKAIKVSTVRSRWCASFNPLSPSIKLQILLLWFHIFLTEVVGRSC